jgi:hypothetical protein
MARYGIRILVAVEDEEGFLGVACGMKGSWRDEEKGGSRAAALHKGGGMKLPLPDDETARVPTRKSSWDGETP